MHAVNSDLHFAAHHNSGFVSIILAHLQRLMSYSSPPKLVLLLSRLTEEKLWLPVVVDPAQSQMTVGTIAKKTVSSDVLKAISFFFKRKVCDIRSFVSGTVD